MLAGRSRMPVCILLCTTVTYMTCLIVHACWGGDWTGYLQCCNDVNTAPLSVWESFTCIKGLLLGNIDSSLASFHLHVTRGWLWCNKQHHYRSCMTIHHDLPFVSLRAVVGHDNTRFTVSWVIHIECNDSNATTSDRVLPFDVWRCQNHRKKWRRMDLPFDDTMLSSPFFTERHPNVSFGGASGRGGRSSALSKFLIVWLNMCCGGSSWHHLSQVFSSHMQ